MFHKRGNREKHLNMIDKYEHVALYESRQKTFEDGDQIQFH